jgi:RNA polymerase sigma-54 factor
MQLGYVIQQEQSQRLLMTPQMKQAIELLQCSGAELLDYVVDALADNPVVDIELPKFAEAVPLQHRTTARQTGAVGTSRQDALEQVAAAERPMFDELASQLRCMRLPADVLPVALFLVGCLDENGYLVESVVDVAHLLAVPVEQVETALGFVQQCDPKGIGARNLKECLLLQIDGVPPEDRALTGEIIEHYLPEVAAGRLNRIAKLCKTSAESVQRAVHHLKQLNPRPGLQLAQGYSPLVFPDVIVRKFGGEFVIVTNEQAVPRLYIRPEYREWVERADSETASYLVKKLQAAEWVARCLEQRRITLYRVAEAIVHVQQDFLDCGVSALKPLTLRQVAEKIGVHESTVSRAIRGKYMLTPHGLFDMKFFFTAELASEDGGTSPHAAKHEIRKIIVGEDPHRPLSDEAVARLLQRQGIRISRRTVAKYRDEMNIPPSWRRKQLVR